MTPRFVELMSLLNEQLRARVSTPLFLTYVRPPTGEYVVRAWTVAHGKLCSAGAMFTSEQAELAVDVQMITRAAANVLKIGLDETAAAAARQAQEERTGG